MQADYFRYCALLASGGIYSDVDYRCTGSLRRWIEDEESDAFLLRREARNTAGEVSMMPVLNSFMIFKQAGHPLLELALSMATSGVEQTLGEEGSGKLAAVFVTGPFIFTGLRLALELGSLEAFSDRLAGTGLAPLGERICETIGEYERVVRAFDRVRLLTLEEAGVLDGPGFKLPYKATKDHWANFGSDIYRSAG